MKKLVLILAAAAALAVSCQKAESFKEAETPSFAAGEYNFDFIVNGGGFTLDTKADATTGWTEGERVFIFFQPEGEGLLDRYLTMTYNGSSFSAGSSIQYGCLGKGGKLSAVYVPYLKSGIKPVYNDGEWTIDGGDVYYSCATGVSYTVNDADVTATIAMSIPDGYVQFAVPATKAADGDRMSCNTVDAYTCVTLGSDLKFSETPVEGKKMTGHKDGDKVYFWGKKNSVEADKCEFTIASSVTGDNLEKSVESLKVVKNNAYNLAFLQVAPLPGKFSTGNDKLIQFAPGNLRYTVSTGKWSFFDHQYDCGPITSYEDGHAEEISLFTWGYGEWSTIPDTRLALTNHQANNEILTNAEDWGSIIDDGNTWHTPTIEEWNYILFGRTDAETKIGYATVCGSTGIILLSDTFIDPMKNKGSGAFVPKSTTGYDANVYSSEEDWYAMEKAGALFLPVARYRVDNFLGGTAGNYNSSTSWCNYGTGGYWQIYFFGDEVGIDFMDNRYYAMSVRLVTEAK